MKTLEKSLMADGSTSDMLLLKVLTAGIVKVYMNFKIVCIIQIPITMLTIKF